jgi:hypothetical protein
MTTPAFKAARRALPGLAPVRRCRVFQYDEGISEHLILSRPDFADPTDT